MATVDDWQIGKSLTECLSHLLTSSVATDVTFVLGEEQEVVHAHKTLLICRSPVFFAMLEGPMYEKGEILIPDFNKAPFLIFLRYLYTDELEFDVQHIAAVLTLAEKYMVDKLMVDGIACVTKNITAENVYSVLEDAHAYQQQKLRDTCLQIIAENAQTYLKSSGFSQLCPACVHLITESDDLDVKQEEEVFVALLRWSKAECQRQNKAVTDENIRHVLGDNLSTVRFPLMEMQFLTNEVCTTDILTPDEICSAVRSCAEKSSQLKSRKGIKRPRRVLRYNDVHRPTKPVPMTSIQVYFEIGKPAALHGICVFACLDEESVMELTNVTVLENRKSRCHYRANHTVRKLFQREDKTVDVFFNNQIMLEPSVEYKITLDLSPETFYGNEAKLLSDESKISFFYYTSEDKSKQIAGVLLSET